VPPPSLDLAPSIFQGQEPIHVQALVAQPTVEAFDVRVLHWFARLDEFETYTAFVAPGSQGSASKLRSIVQNNRFRLTCSPLSAQS